MGTDLDKKIDSWQEQLLDLTRRNNMVDFSATKTKSLPTKNDNWLELTTHLAEGDDLYVYKPDVDETSDPAGDAPAEEQPADADSGARSDGAVVTERPATELVSIREPEATESSLYNVDLNQRKHVQEKGVDSLYLAVGMLEWYSVDYAEEQLRSPLALVSVELERETVSDPDRHDYVISSTDEVILNPALRKKLTSEFGIELPGDETVDLAELDVTVSAVESLIQGRDRWEISDDVVLGIFDFAKLSLYTDLDENRGEIKSNPIVRALNGDQSALNADASSVPGAETLDEAVDPMETHQVLEADSSQQEAIEAAKSDVSFVLQGPPGTGKSQTIANIIAEKLAANETVLFVSEKQAALDVVKDRLDEVDLGRFCLSAHGKHATKDSILSSLETELNAPTVKAPSERASQLGKLRQRRDDLNEYGEILHESYGALNETAYDAHGALASYGDVNAPLWTPPTAFEVTRTEFDTAIETLEQLANYSDELSNYDSHPWRHTTTTTWQVNTGDRLRDSLTAQQDVVDAMAETAAAARDELGIAPDSVREFRAFIDALAKLVDRPDVSWHDALFDPAFVDGESEVASLAATSQELAAKRASISEHYESSIYSLPASDLHGELAQYGLLRYIQPSYRRLKKRVLSHATDDYNPGQSALLDDLQTLIEITQLERELEDYEDVIETLGPLYEKTATDWDRVKHAQEWVRTISTNDTVDLSSIESLLCTAATPPDFESWHTKATTLQSELEDAANEFTRIQAVDDLTTPDGTQLYAASFEATKATLADLEDALPKLKDWIQFSNGLESATDTIASGYIDAFLDGDYEADALVSGFRKQFYTAFLNGIYERTDLGEFNTNHHEQILQEFRRLDKQQLELSKVEIQHRVTQQRPSMNLEHASSSQQVTLRREIEKQRRRKPLRELFATTGDMITRLKPCFMMSPLAVAEYLRQGAIEFDTVIFDEASQVMPQDAISSLIRGDQAIIAGDTKQLPPTQFFSSDVEADDDVREDLESILDEAAAVLPEMHLRWHYRSRSDELIAFSNQQYYAGRLNTFPDNDAAVDTGVDFEFVEDGIYDRGGSRQNVPEAHRIVDILHEYATEKPDKSVGVVAFSKAQERAIRDTIEERRKEDPALDAFVDEDDALEGFFVKNLEAVQGDERDVMLFSVTYGPDQSGKITMNFGPLNNDGGERRLNVAVTRAKERVVVVSSLQPGDIDLSRTQARGVHDFKTYLQYAKQGERALVRDDDPGTTLTFDSEFEEAVYDTLTDRGYDVETQIQSSGYSIDLAIQHPEYPGRYLLGIECDGAAYHSTKTARDRDRTRQLILEDLGWTIHRIWSPDWASNQEQELQKIESKVDDLLADNFEPEHEVDVDVESAEAVPEPAEPDGGTDLFEPYQAPPERSRGNRDFEDIPNRRVRSALLEIVEDHGPIEKDAVFTLLVQQYGISRVGKKIRRSLNGIITHLVGDEIVQQDGYLWPTDIEEVSVRTNTGADNRPADEIPKEEFAKAAYHILENGLEMTKDDLVLETARKFGWSRRGQRIQSEIEAAIAHLISIGAIDDADTVRACDVDIDKLLLAEVYRG